jgi:hypothetical protein
VDGVGLDLTMAALARCSAAGGGSLMLILLLVVERDGHRPSKNTYSGL